MGGLRLIVGAALAGLAAGAPARIFGADNIAHHIRCQKRDHSRGAASSIATGNRWGGPHLHKRERARRARQAARIAERQRARQVARNGPESPFPSLSRRGLFTTWPDGRDARVRRG